MFHGRDIPWLLSEWATRTPDNVFLAWEPFDCAPRSWTYAQFAADVEAVAASLAKRGVKEGECVLIHLDNSPEFIISWFACARIGAIAVSTNTRSVMRDMTYTSTATLNGIMTVHHSLKKPDDYGTAGPMNLMVFLQSDSDKSVLQSRKQNLY